MPEIIPPLLRSIQLTHTEQLHRTRELLRIALIMRDRMLIEYYKQMLEELEKEDRDEIGLAVV